MRHPNDLADAPGGSCCGLGVKCAQCGVRTLAVCGVLEEHDLAKLAAIGQSLRIKAGETLFHEHDEAASVFTVTRGVFKLYKLFDGRCQVIGFMLPGDFIGLACHETYGYAAEAITEADICRFASAPYGNLLGQAPAMERRLREYASNQLAGAQAQMLLLGRMSAQERIAHFLLDMLRRSRGVSYGLVWLPMTRADMADFLGLTVETVSRGLTAMKRDGLIAIPNRDHIQVLDQVRMSILAKQA